MKINAIGHLVKTNPIQTQSNPIAERVKLMQSLYLQRIMKKNAAKGYEKTKPKQSQFPQRPKMSASVYVIEDYENKTAHRLRKNKPKQSQSEFLARSVSNKSKLLSSCSLTERNGFYIMVFDRIINKAFAEVTGAWWCPWSSKPVWG